VRTEELLAARRLDGGRQYFARAFDFGFSKSAEETFRHWPRDAVLGDVVRTVRAFRPHVVVAIFSGTPADGHGHHQASGILAREAYDLAADTCASRRPRSARRGRCPSSTATPATAAPRPRRCATTPGATTRCSGRSYAELAAISRTQHKSQGQGGRSGRGRRW
jgi:LmbE family N-acetylglucosaminyl deacetylase